MSDQTEFQQEARRLLEQTLASIEKFPARHRAEYEAGVINSLKLLAQGSAILEKINHDAGRPPKMQH